MLTHSANRFHGFCLNEVQKCRGYGQRKPQISCGRKRRKMRNHRGTGMMQKAILAAGVWSVSLLPGFTVLAQTVPEGTITASNVKEKNATVTAYQLVDGTYSEEGKLTGYVLTDAANMKIADMQNPTAAEVAAIADYIEANPGKVQGKKMILQDAGTGTYRLQTEPGEYLILVTGSGEVVYNPAVVSVNVTNADQMLLENGTVDYSEWFRSGDTAYLKSSTTGLKKSVLSDGKKVSGVSAAVGETLNFVIDSMTIPSYSASYPSVTYQITDHLESGCFGEIQNLKVRVNGVETAQGADTWGIQYGPKRNSFELSFSDAFIRSHGAQTVEITYQSVLTGKAGLNFAENTNTAVLRYSSNPADAKGMKELTSTTYQYTFGLGANLDAEASKEDQVETGELNKVTRADGASSYEKVSQTYSGTGATSTMRSKYALKGAQFSLYTDAAMTQKAAQAESDANGRITFTGLKEGSYYLKETQAPAGYAANEKKFHITITPEFREDGVMSRYTVTTKEIRADGSETEAGSAIYTSVPEIQKDQSVTNTVTRTETPAEILNVPLAELPSAGGAGTLGFVLAAAGMGGGMAIWKLAGRKRMH